MTMVENRFNCMSFLSTRDVLHSFTSRYALRAQVEYANSGRLSALQGDTQIYQAYDIPGVDITGKIIDKRRATELADQTLAARELPLKIGAQVMLIMVCRVYILKGLRYIIVTIVSYFLTEPRQGILRFSQWIVGHRQGLCYSTTSKGAEVALP